MKTVFSISAVCAALVLVGCSTLVRFETDVPGAKVKFDNLTVGTTPFQRSVDGAIWENPDVLIEKPGYKTMHVKLIKEIKVGPAIGGAFMPAIWLWAWGPVSYQYFELDPEN